jgi:hypothetical protein
MKKLEVLNINNTLKKLSTQTYKKIEFKFFIALNIKLLSPIISSFQEMIPPIAEDMKIKFEEFSAISNKTEDVILKYKDVIEYYNNVELDYIKLLDTDYNEKINWYHIKKDDVDDSIDITELYMLLPLIKMDN